MSSSANAPAPAPAPRALAAPSNRSNPTQPTARKKLSRDQIVAIVLSCFIIAGITVMALAFAGVFNETGPTVALTPTLTPAVGGTVPINT